MPSYLNDFSDDKKIILGIREGNRAAFKELFNRYYEKLVRFSIYKISDVDISKDLVQELFVRIWNLRDTLDPDKSIKAYLYRALNNLIKNHFKKYFRTVLLNDAILPQKKSDQDTKIDFLSAIDDLPEKIKIVIMLSRIEGFKYSEIADICNISVKAVEKRMSKGLKLLRIRLSR